MASRSSNSPGKSRYSFIAIHFIITIFRFCDERRHPVCRKLARASFDQLLAYFWRSQQWTEDDLTTKEGVEEAMFRGVMIIRSACVHAPFSHFASEMYRRGDRGDVIREPAEAVFESLLAMSDCVMDGGERSEVITM